MGIFKILILAETKGFEPLIRGCRIHDFESRAFNRSATSPRDGHYKYITSVLQG